MTKGTVVIGGHRFPITEVLLTKSGVELVFAICGPCEPFSGDVTVFGEDGTGCWQGKLWECAEGVPSGTVLEVHYWLRVTWVEDLGRVMRV